MYNAVHSPYTSGAFITFSNIFFVICFIISLVFFSALSFVYRANHSLAKQHKDTNIFSITKIFSSFFAIVSKMFLKKFDIKKIKGVVYN